MIVVKLQGGLGNQMFQYAAGRSLAIKNESSVLLDVSFLAKTASLNKEGFTPRRYELEIFDNLKSKQVSEGVLNKFSLSSIKGKFFKFLHLPYHTRYINDLMGFKQNFFLQKPPVTLNGFWQSEKYFIDVVQTLNQDFVFPKLQPVDKNHFILSQINNSNAVSVHVRRGDYVKDAITNAFHGTCSIDYYKKAISFLQEKFSNPFFFFFSDDPLWVKENLLKALPQSLLVQNNEGANTWKDMYLMSKCRHNIIANSSFSWWGAWLNSNQTKMVIAPKKWFADPIKNEETKDLIPESWIKI